MQTFGLFNALGNDAKILCLGAHSDDIEIGCGGILQRLLERNGKLSIDWVVLNAKGVREREARSSAAELVAARADLTMTVQQFRNGYFPYIGAEIKDFFETLKQSRPPDLILTHCRHDLHQDHRLVAELTWNTFRDHLILEYEIPKYDGDLRAPNLFVPLTEQQATAKIEHLLRCFTSQQGKQWFSPDTFRGLLRLRGVECNSPTGLAEAFHARKLTVG